MPDYDAIIIGGGPNGLVLANKLLRAGLTVLLCERKLEVGGGLATEEPTLPGFWHNLHHVFHGPRTGNPCYQALDVARFNARFEAPQVQVGMPLGDGRALALHHQGERTRAAIARLSPRDAATLGEVERRYGETVETALLPALFQPPADSELRSRLEATAAGRELLTWARQSPQEVVDGLFTDEAVRSLFLSQFPLPYGVPDDAPDLGLVAALVLSGAEEYSFCGGGSHVLAQALWRSILVRRGSARGLAPVRRILVERGAAVGVELADGTAVRARRLVASAVDPQQTFLDLLGPEHLAGDFVQRMREWPTSEFSLFGLHLALEEPVRYRAAAFDPDLDQAFMVVLGAETAADRAALWAQLRAGDIPEPRGMYASVPSLHDPSVAPPDRHTALLWQLVPPWLKEGGMEAWDRVAGEYAQRCLEAWRRYALNLTPHNILKTTAFTPLGLAGKITSFAGGDLFHGRLVASSDGPGLPQSLPYRTPVERLYYCGAAAHPRAGPPGAQAHNAFQTIAADLGLPTRVQGEG